MTAETVIDVFQHCFVGEESVILKYIADMAAAGGDVAMRLRRKEYALIEPD